MVQSVRLKFFLLVGILGFSGFSSFVFADPPLFLKQEQGDFVTDKYTTNHISTADIDNDGDMDVFAVNSGVNMLYRNDGGTLVAIPGSGLSNEQALSQAAAWADYDNDGFVDVFVANMSGKNHLYHNEGNAIFRLVLEQPFTDDTGFSQHASWADYDNDGFADLFVSTLYGVNFLYHNIGQGAFERIMEGDIAHTKQDSVIGIWADYNTDGYTDLFVANTNRQADRIYFNHWDGTFVEASAADTGSAVWANWGDIDNDGDIDLFVLNHGGANALYMNQGNGTFLPAPPSLLTTTQEASRTSLFVDSENDGDKDIFVLNTTGQHSLYLNDGTGNFVKDEHHGLGEELVYPGHAIAQDIDNNGAVDILIAQSMGANELDMNTQQENNWVTLTLEDNHNRRNPIGARVSVVAHIRGEEVTQTSFIQESNRPLSFGLGDAESVDEVMVTWPLRTQQTVRTVGVNQHITIVEPENEEEHIGVQDGDMEEMHLDHWQKYGNVHLAKYVSPSTPGDRVMKMDSRGQGAGGMGQTVRLSFGRKYRLTFDYAVSVGTLDVVLANEQGVSVDPTLNIHASLTNGWRHADISFAVDNMLEGDRTLLFTTREGKSFVNNVILEEVDRVVLTRDGDMERPDMSDWQQYGQLNEFKKYATADLHGMALRMKRYTPGIGGARQQVRLLANTQYHLAFDYAVSYGDFRFSIVNGQGDVALPEVSHEIRGATGGWRHTDVSFVTGEDVGVENYILFTIQAGVSGGKAFIDTVLLEQAD